jgi:hypothetical protein
MKNLKNEQSVGELCNSQIISFSQMNYNWSCLRKRERDDKNIWRNTIGKPFQTL